MFLNMLRQSLREVCATPGEYIKQQFGFLLSTIQLSSMKNGHATLYCVKSKKTQTEQSICCPYIEPNDQSLWSQNKCTEVV